MTEAWNITLRLGAWSGSVRLPKEKYPTAKEAINAALQAVEMEVQVE